MTGEPAITAAAIGAIRATLHSGQRAPLPPQLAEDAALNDLLDETVDLCRFAVSIAQGDLDSSVNRRGALTGGLKGIQASLRHLTWQTQRVAAGDFSQRVDFFGAFSDAFNSMVVALEDARTQLAQSNDELRALAVRLEEFATTDALTGACNRRKFDELVATEFGRTKRYGQPLSLLMLDADHFKHINDAHGHEAGDMVLAGLADAIRAELRVTDSLTRWGGEEFVILAPGVSADDAAALAERIRASVAAHEWLPNAGITVSVGIAEFCPGDTPDRLLARADAALYRAKAAGRNCVHVAA